MSCESRSAIALGSGAIRAWLTFGTQRFDATVDEAMSWARLRWSEQEPQPTVSSVITGDSPYPDRFHALVSVVRNDYSAAPEKVLRWYRAIEATSWDDDQLSEKVEILGSLAYCLSRQYRRAHEPALSYAWQKKVVTLARQKPSVSEFLTLSSAQCSDQIREIFLTDVPVLLSLCENLLDLGNHRPSESLIQAQAAHDFISHSALVHLHPEERSWFLAYLEILVAIGHKYGGHYGESGRWLSRATKTCCAIDGAEILLAQIEFMRRALALESGRYIEAQEGLAELKSRFELYGMRRSVARCGFMEGTVLKLLNRPSEALKSLRQVAEEEHPEVEQWLRGLALIEASEVLSTLDYDDAAVDALMTAWHLVKDSDSAIAHGHFHGMKAQVLRDHGLLDQAVCSYRESIVRYHAGGVRSIEALLRLVLAETLLAAGRDGEAAEEIVAALPIIESLGLVREAVVAVALLRESLTRQESNPEALRILRREIQNLSKRGAS